MSTTAQDTCVSVSQVTDALMALGDALARPDLPQVLATEPLLENLSRALAAATATPADRAVLLPLLDQARRALHRAARLGDSLTHAAAATTYAVGVAQGYDRDGRANQRGALAAFDTRA